MRRRQAAFVVGLGVAAAIVAAVCAGGGAAFAQSTGSPPQTEQFAPASGSDYTTDDAPAREAAPAHGPEEDTGATGAGVALARRVVVVLVTGMTWEDLDSPQAVGLRRVMDSGWLANINCPTVGPQRTVAQVLVSLGAAARAAAGRETGAAYGAREKIEYATATEAFVRRTGHLPSDARVLHLGIATLEWRNARLPYPVNPGLMGSVVGALGRKTAVLGNSDVVLKGENPEPRREAVALAMDEIGRVDYGGVSTAVLMPDREMAYGVRSNIPLLLYRYRSLPDKVGLVVIDLGDILRASRYSAHSAPAAAAFLRGRAITRASEFVTRLAAIAGDEAAIMILSPVARDGGAGPAQPTPFSLVVPDALPGYAWSATTKKPGLVSGTDLVRTVRHVLTGVDAASSGLPGRTIVRAGAPTTPSFAALGMASKIAVVSDKTRPAILWAWLLLQAVGASAAVILLRSKRADESAGRLTEALLLLLVSLPLPGFLAGWLWPLVAATRLGAQIATVPAYTVTIVAPAVALAAGLSLAHLKASRQLIGVLGATACVVLVDQLVGGYAASGTLLGYSLIDGGRYYGIGNEAWAIAFTCAALATALVLESDRAEWRSRRWLVAGLFAAVALLVGLPFFGANVGGFIAVVSGLATIWLGWDSKRFSFSAVAAVAAIVLLGLALFVGLDAARGLSQATHVSSAATEIARGGVEGVMGIVRRKLATNLDVFTRLPLSWLFLLVVTVLVMERRRPSGRAAAFLAHRPRLATALTGILVAGVVGTLFNDTGVTIPALMLAMALPAVLLLMLAEARWRREALDL